MISPIAHRPIYQPTSLRPGHPNKALSSASSVRFGHGPGHIHANGETCTDKHCTEGQKGERQFCLQPLFDKVKAFFGKIRDFFYRLFGKSPAVPATEQKASPTNQTPPPTQSTQSSNTANPHPAHAHQGHQHDGKGCCSGKHDHNHAHATSEKTHAH